MSAEEPNIPDADTQAPAPASDSDRTDPPTERPEQSAAFKSFVLGQVESDPDARPGWSRLAIASLVPGVVGFLWPVGLVLAVVALVRIRRTRQDGRWAAVTGLVLCAIWAIFGTSLLWKGTSDGEHIRTISGYDLKVGDCFGPEPAGVSLGREVATVPCSQLHHGEVFALADMGDAVYGSTADRADGAAKACAATAAGYLPPDRTVPVSARIDYLMPLGNNVVLRPHRTVICAFVDPDTGWTGSLREGTTSAPAPTP
ncbi:DUF4190 domain-containing protein [Kitasatospora sp. MAP5-34]|uniref:DUF4190 domain-containing protein n=1 Tax=Kitasatospora sp. MAP5-34 TaxID=3035102 RepID=UPI0024743855|nr:DUF4190 domain-containing protein [Kitasatospora sp. MAP5-34]MDH6578402.1 hypothetical protein [Kitasatospora sp. MAP5-34]